jgi:hypothetical protein
MWQELPRLLRAQYFVPARPRTRTAINPATPLAEYQAQLREVRPTNSPTDAESPVWLKRALIPQSQQKSSGRNAHTSFWQFHAR